MQICHEAVSLEPSNIASEDKATNMHSLDRNGLTFSTKSVRPGALDDHLFHSTKVIMKHLDGQIEKNGALGN